MKTASRPVRAESTEGGTDQALILRLNLQSNPMQLAHYELRHPCLHNERREPQKRLLPGRETLKLTKAARAMVLFLVSVRRRYLERAGEETPNFSWEGPKDSPVASLAEALHLSSQAWMKAWFGFFPPKISRTKSLSSLLFPHSNGGGKPHSVSLRLPSDPGQTCPGFRPLNPASIRVFSSRTEELLGEEELGGVTERLFEEGGWQSRPYWSDEPPKGAIPSSGQSPAGQGATEVLVPSPQVLPRTESGKGQTFRYRRTTTPAGQTSEEIELEGDWPLDKILQLVSGQQRRPPGLLLVPVTPAQARELQRVVKESERKYFLLSLDQVLPLLLAGQPEASDQAGRVEASNHFFLKLGSEDQNELTLRVLGEEGR